MPPRLSPFPFPLGAPSFAFYLLPSINEIPSVMVTFVALIMFLQMGVGMTMATVYSALLLLPWALQPLMRRLLPRTDKGGVYKCCLLGTECLTAVAMLSFALFMGNTPLLMLAMLMCISGLTAWHDLLARMYYGSYMAHAQGRWASVVRAMSSQVTMVLTYGLMIMAVGVLEIYFRQRAMWYSWALCCYILAGVYGLMTLVNAVLLLGNAGVSIRASVPHYRHRQWMPQVGILALLLFPQGLMFFSRTIFLLARPHEGGLGCTLQEVGFAQGTIGVMAFLLGISVGQRILHRWGGVWMEHALAVCLGLSPVVYLAMTQWPPSDLLLLSGHTFMAQLLFGLGLNGCRRRIEYISGERYRNTVNPLYVPIISLCLLPAMAVSGYLVERLSFRGLYLMDVLCAVVSWIVIAVALFNNRSTQ